MENKVNYFIELAKLECEVEKRNWLSYISWANAWDEVKRVYPDATYEKIKNTNDNSYLFRSWTGGGVEVDVTINGITHRADLAVTGLTNQEIKYEMIKSTDIHNTLQRAFAKAIAMHGIGLYVYRGEDFPEETGHDVKKTESKEAPKTYPKNDDVKWYNDVTKNLDTWKDMVVEGKTTPAEIIEKIESQWYKINTANKALINNLF